ncbi:MAG: DUF4962 domain-containing protein [Planctomycetes bacterium]|nr:DUF4962 domain-containing protein [Planctomycetota bacterium]
MRARSWTDVIHPHPTLPLEGGGLYCPMIQRTLLPALFVFSFALCVFAAEPPEAQHILATLKPRHPRLLIDMAGFDALRERVKTDDRLKAWVHDVIDDADQLLGAKPVYYHLPDGKRLLSVSRAVVERSYELAFAYRMTGEKKYADRLWTEMRTVCAFDDWHPPHFLDTAEMTHGVAIAYDWLYDVWTPEQRKTMREAIARMGLTPALKYYREHTWWANVEHNWNQVCNGGETVGALAIGDEEPALAGEILAAAVRSVPKAMASYEPDGAWGEGPSYWGYATSYNTLMVAALDSALGTDFDLSEEHGYTLTALFPMYMTGPTGLTFNYSDAHPTMRTSPCLLWLAHRYDEPAAAWWGIHRMSPTVQSILWYRGDGQSPDALHLPLDRYWRGSEVVSFRTSWTDPQAMYFAMQAGSNRVNHNHLDLGSFVLDALGERWAMDLGSDNYNMPDYFGSKRYTYYRLRAEAHNTLVMNPDEGPDQNPRATAKIAAFSTNDDLGRAVADLTPAYDEAAKSVTRTVVFDRKSNQITLDDAIDPKAKTDLWWFVTTEATVELTDGDRTALLHRNDQTMRVTLIEPADAKFEVRSAEPLPTSPNPSMQATNDEARKLTIHTSIDKLTKISVRFEPVRK